MRSPAQDIVHFQDLRVEMHASHPHERNTERSFTLRVSAPGDIGASEETTRPFPLSAHEIERALASITQASQQWVTRGTILDTLDPLKEIGTRLFTSLFEGQNGHLYQQSLSQAQARGEGLRLRLEIDDPALAAIPWEALYDVYRQLFITLATDSQIIRERIHPQHAPLAPIKPPLRVLVIVADTQDVEAKESLDALHQLDQEMEDLKIKYVTLSDWDAVQKELMSDTYHFLHLVDDSALSTIRPRVLGNEPLFQLEMLQNLRELRFVYMSANDSADAAFELATIVPAAFGIVGSIRYAAKQFCTEGFYRAILTGQPIETAITQGRQTVYRRSAESREWALPVLYTQAPESIIMRPSKESANQAPLDFSTSAPAGNGATGKSEERAMLEIRLKILQRNQAVIEEQRARYGTDAPLELLNQHKEIQGEIDKVKADLDKLQ
jgi:hypothetical protein